MMKRQIGQIGGVRQQVALLDMLDMSWYNGCPPWGGHPAPSGRVAQKLPYYDGIKKSRGLYDSFKKSPVYI